MESIREKRERGIIFGEKWIRDGMENAEQEKINLWVIRGRKIVHVRLKIGLEGNMEVGDFLN